MNLSDIFARDLRGRAYIEARGLTRKVKLGGQPDPESHPHCEKCRLEEFLPAVQQIAANWRPMMPIASAMERKAA